MKTAIALLTLACSLCAVAVQAETAIEKGKALAAEPNGGNCLSCHYVPEGEMTGTVAPPLIQMKVRYPDKASLRAQIWDATVRNPESVMPPYGRHSVLTEQEIDWILEYVYSL